MDGLFMNADTGFDADNLRRKCEEKGIIANIARNKRNSSADDDNYFDEKLYKQRYSIERINAWLDSFRSLLNRFDTSLSSWIGFNYLAFIIIGIKKFKKVKMTSLYVNNPFDESLKNPDVQVFFLAPFTKIKYPFFSKSSLILLNASNKSIPFHLDMPYF